MQDFEAGILARQIGDVMKYHHGGEGFAVRVLALPGVGHYCALTVGGSSLYVCQSEKDWEDQKDQVIRNHSDMKALRG